MIKIPALEQEIRRWIGVRWRHQGRSFKTGVDCIGFCLQVYQSVGAPFEDRKDYARRSDGRALRWALERQMQSVPHTNLQSGDLAYFNSGRGGVHVGLILRAGETVQLVHAHAARRKVVQEPLLSFAVPSAAFRIKEITSWQH